MEGIDFVAVDVETANYWRSSICQIGVVMVRDGCVSEMFETLVDPKVPFDPYPWDFGADVADAPTTSWPRSRTVTRTRSERAHRHVLSATGWGFSMRSGAARSASSGNASAGSPPAWARADWKMPEKTRCTKSVLVADHEQQRLPGIPRQTAGSLFSRQHLLGRPSQRRPVVEAGGRGHAKPQRQKGGGGGRGWQHRRTGDVCEAYDSERTPPRTSQITLIPFRDVGSLVADSAKGLQLPSLSPGTEPRGPERLFVPQQDQ